MNIANIHEGRIPNALVYVFDQLDTIYGRPKSINNVDIQQFSLGSQDYRITRLRTPELVLARARRQYAKGWLTKAEFERIETKCNSPDAE